MLGEAAAHLQVASLMAMLCDGCRVDGQGFNPVALDQLLWRFGILVHEALQLKHTPWEQDIHDIHDILLVQTLRQHAFVVFPESWTHDVFNIRNPLDPAPCRMQSDTLGQLPQILDRILMKRRKASRGINLRAGSMSNRRKLPFKEFLVTKKLQRHTKKLLVPRGETIPSVLDKLGDV